MFTHFGKHQQLILTRFTQDPLVSGWAITSVGVVRLMDTSCSIHAGVAITAHIVCVETNKSKIVNATVPFL